MNFYKTTKLAKFKPIIIIFLELIVRIILETISEIYQYKDPFIRYIQAENWHNHFYPHTDGERAKHFAEMVLGAYFFMIVILLIQSSYRISIYYQKKKESTIENRSLITKHEINEKKFIAHTFLLPQLALFWGISLAYITARGITEVLKVLIGRPRPDFIHRCKPEGFDFNNPNFSVLDGYPICTNTNIWKVMNGRKSFPSGHSAVSMSFGIFGVLLVYRGLKTLKLSTSILFFLTILFMYPWAYIAISRNMDYRHHWEDIVVGSLIGAIISYLCFRMYQKDITKQLDPSDYEITKKEAVSDVESQPINA